MHREWQEGGKKERKKERKKEGKSKVILRMPRKCIHLRATGCSCSFVQSNVYESSTEWGSENKKCNSNHMHKKLSAQKSLLRKEGGNIDASC